MANMRKNTLFLNIRLVCISEKPLPLKPNIPFKTVPRPDRSSNLKMIQPK